MNHTIPLALSIAGTDPTGGAGIQADLKTFQEREVYGMSVITSVVAQNTIGVQDVHHIPLDFIESQLKSVLSDLPPHSVKTGMIATPEMMEMIAAYLRNQSIPYVLDPVMVAKSGHALMDPASQDIVREALVPLATIVTPNIPEAEILVDFQIQDLYDAQRAAKVLVEELGAEAAVVKGGHLKGEAVDILYVNNRFYTFPSIRTNTKHTHGTGCTFSAVLAAELAKQKSIVEAVSIAKKFITDAIRYTLNIGNGNGPTNHWGYRLKNIPTVKGENHHV
ncbi:bifunctional hydroxymethylpyrimidine kinase/phosphomethylpyrimidine kinase [Radiobacillus kanasensis]|uniref:bifunctional hydroxymethylpyrimidine kinase/phosphomethylpyrimidine kinase n=1 Tax=Radiobacillus kanasensis TaxID=2844358 RepID=UPI001E3586B5|nr:bifunctional hydroxymethylpyrimidine kinase/phosphomethylpyrimidine kinase [Radiobacillus kanasensis]UFU01409.1 bifunctional hydroxymethylpyrimidine kinase/phosphomethylpyrimidine kinase [Radiobacillus kanasensis]